MWIIRYLSGEKEKNLFRTDSVSCIHHSLFATWKGLNSQHLPNRKNANRSWNEVSLTRDWLWRDTSFSEHLVCANEIPIPLHDAFDLDRLVRYTTYVRHSSLLLRLLPTIWSAFHAVRTHRLQLHDALMLNVNVHDSTQRLLFCSWTPDRLRISVRFSLSLNLRAVCISTDLWKS